MSFGNTQHHASQANSHIYQSFPNFVKKKNIYLPLSIFTCRFKNFAIINSFLSLAITSNHLPYLAVHTIFYSYFRIPTVVYQLLTSCLPNRLPYFPVISKFCNAKNFPAACHIDMSLEKHRSIPFFNVTFQKHPGVFLFLQYLICFISVSKILWLCNIQPHASFADCLIFPSFPKLYR